MAKEVKKPEEAEAPAYMVQYTSLMMLLLAFFIAMLSMVKFDDQMAGFQSGVGSIRNALGVSGGLGVLPYIRQLRGNPDQVYPGMEERRQRRDEEVAIGHPKDRIDKNVLYQKDFMVVDKTPQGRSIRITTPIVFSPESAILSSATRIYLDWIGSVLHSFAGSVMIIRAYSNTLGDRDKDELLAMERAVAIARYLEGQSRISRERIRAVGYSDLRYFGKFEGARPFEEQGVAFFIQKE